ncbi:MAG: hypothetical protein A2W75_07770 [Nitrospinae bacterium RIFCSPLOWO2_12_39_15]|nr:MAG: hypothetical protein A3D97_00600 [Nitrospinae bacterium RIFCSPHIGHO2_12_FULL_39_42]OGW11976.1 MAG: hypothetical protein A2W75_07770 [Nitrospinae bacterium RIFCSPLOWO2_12_39_15]
MGNKAQRLYRQFICCLLILIMIILSCGKSKKIVDKTAPSNPSITINNGAASTTSTAVTISLSASDDVGVRGYCVSESSTTPSVSDSCWTSVISATSYSSSVSFTLSGGSVGNNTNTVYVWFKDNAGNISSSASDSITLTVSDTTAPSNPSVSINSDAASTTSTAVTLNLSASDDVGVRGYCVSESSTTPSVSDSCWTTVTSTTSYSAAVTFTLSSGGVGDNTKTVYVWFRDSAGNVSSFANDSITLTVSDKITPSKPSVPISSGAISTTSTSKSAMLKLPDTGQTGDYTTTAGEDSDYTINPPSYTDNGNGTITDNVTGLTWQKEDDNIERAWDNANTYCDDLTLGGSTDWRLPSDMELMSIVNYGIYNPAINTAYFPDTNSSFYWLSNTITSDSSTYTLHMNFTHGFIINYVSKSNRYYVRCVRGDITVTGNFTDNANGTVTDNNTGLMWQKDDDNTAREWESAITYCEGLSLGGDNDWRLPNIKELLSIIDTTYFPNTNSSYYWSSTTDADYYTNAWLVYFGDGNDNDNGPTSSYYVRCVRGK